MRRSVVPALRLVAVSLLGAALSVVAASAWATTMRPLGLAELVRSADAVVVGTVLDSHSRWERPEGGRIITEHQLRIDESWRGVTRVGEVVRVITWGGIVGTLGQRVPGEAQLGAGDRLVLFLARDSAGAWHPVSMSQGAWSIAEGKAIPQWDPAHGVAGASQGVQAPELVQTLRLRIEAFSR